MEAVRMVYSAKNKHFNLTTKELNALKNKTLRAAYISVSSWLCRLCTSTKYTVTVFQEPPFMTNISWSPNQKFDQVIQNQSGIIAEILKSVAAKYQLRCAKKIKNICLG